MTLFVNEKDPLEEKWSGPRTGVRAAGEIFRADNAHPIKEFPSILGSKASSYSHIFADLPAQKDTDGFKKLLKKLSKPLTRRSYDHDATMSLISSSRRRPLRPQIAPLRAIKSENELRVMRAAADISGRAHAKVCIFITVFIAVSFCRPCDLHIRA